MAPTIFGATQNPQQPLSGDWVFAGRAISWWDKMEMVGAGGFFLPGIDWTITILRQSCKDLAKTYRLGCRGRCRWRPFASDMGDKDVAYGMMPGDIEVRFRQYASEMATMLIFGNYHLSPVQALKMRYVMATDWFVFSSDFHFPLSEVLSLIGLVQSVAVIVYILFSRGSYSPCCRSGFVFFWFWVEGFCWLGREPLVHWIYFISFYSEWFLLVLPAFFYFADYLRLWI